MKEKMPMRSEGIGIVLGGLDSITVYQLVAADTSVALLSFRRDHCGAIMQDTVRLEMDVKYWSNNARYRASRRARYQCRCFLRRRLGMNVRRLQRVRYHCLGDSAGHQSFRAEIIECNRDYETKK